MIDQKLITFLTLIEEKTYLSTAQKLFVTQPSVTHHIQNLEKEYGITIFKNSRTLELTPEGSVLYEYAKNCLIEEKELINNLNKKEDNLVLEVGFTNILADMKNIGNILNSTEMYFNCQVDHYNKIVDNVKNGELDFGIIDHNFYDDKLESITLFQNKIILIAKPNGKYSDLNIINKDILQKATIIMPPTYSGLYEAINQAFKNKNMKLEYKDLYYGATTNLIISLVESFDGIGFVYESCVIDKIISGKLKRIELLNFEPYQNVFLIYSNNAADFTKKKILIDKVKKNKEA